MSGAITVTIVSARGSVPREVGTSMQVTAKGQSGTIGGGRLEWEATRIARDMLAQGQGQAERSFPLGPDLGQCCGGAVVLRFSKVATPPPPPDTKLWIWGAGHVGRALVQVIAPLELCEITWVDTGPERFPEADAPDLRHAPNRLIATDLPRAVRHAPREAHHLILTYSHDHDLALCHAVLQHGFASAGLIGSATKWARFRKRLTDLGHSDAQIDRITCPIGDKRFGKHPQAIAVGIAAQLLSTGAPARVHEDERA